MPSFIEAHRPRLLAFWAAAACIEKAQRRHCASESQQLDLARTKGRFTVVKQPAVWSSFVQLLGSESGISKDFSIKTRDARPGRLSTQMICSTQI